MTLELKSIRGIPFAIMACVLMLFGIIVANMAMNQRLGTAEEARAKIQAAEMQAYELSLAQERSLEDGVCGPGLQTSMEAFEVSCRACHSGREDAAIASLKATFDSLFLVERGICALYDDIRATSLDLVHSVKYIHRHHLAYLENFAMRGGVSQDYSREEGASRQLPAASETEILEAVFAVQVSLLDLMSVYQLLGHGENPVKLRVRFGRAMEDFYSQVNAFEDLSLDAQDGILVEELLLKGRGFEKTFDRLLAYERKTALSMPGWT